jgi:hypothetical protein
VAQIDVVYRRTIMATPLPGDVIALLPGQAASWNHIVAWTCPSRDGVTWVQSELNMNNVRRALPIKPVDVPASLVTALTTNPDGSTNTLRVFKLLPGNYQMAWRRTKKT